MFPILWNLERDFAHICRFVLCLCLFMFMFVCDIYVCSNLKKMSYLWKQVKKYVPDFMEFGKRFCAHLQVCFMFMFMSFMFVCLFVVSLLHSCLFIFQFLSFFLSFRLDWIHSLELTCCIMKHILRFII